MPSFAIRLVVPARREALGVVRAVTAGAASGLGLGFDRVEEARLAVNEAAALLIRDGGSTSLTCELSLEQGFEVAIDADPGPGEWPPQGWLESLERAVFSSVTADYELTSGPGVRLSFAAGT